jgi:glycosyltransferase involved in cell wall biosynthesis
MADQPLITIIVLSYKSSRYILETLDSVLAQSYPLMELIVADDASPDDSVKLAQTWVAEHGNRFTTAHVIGAEKNTGIAGNCNRAMAMATGEWIKLIAADDILMPECLSGFAEEISKGTDAAVLFSRMEKIDEHSNYLGPYYYPGIFFGFGVDKQLTYLLHHNYLTAPSALMRTLDLREAGLFDEAYPMMEDLPVWIKFLELGKRIRGVDKTLVRYRVHQSLSYPVVRKRHVLYQQSIEEFDKRVRLPLSKRLSKRLYWTVKIDICVDYIVQRPLLVRVCKPGLWLWAKYGPYRVPSS